MNAEKVLASLVKIGELHNIAQTPEFEALAQSLREDIALAERKKSGGASRFKAALRFSKKVHKEYAESRPKMAGTYISNGKQYIMHNHYAVRFDNPMDGLVMAEEGYTLSLDWVFESYDVGREVALPSLADLKAKLKVDKAEGNLNHGRSIIEIQGVHYNTDYLMQLVEMVEPQEAFFLGGTRHPNLIMIGDGAVGVVCPLNI